jgi:hypothetical protein
MPTTFRTPLPRRQRRAAPPTARPGNPGAFARGWNALPGGGGAGGQVLPLRAARLKGGIISYQVNALRLLRQSR